MKSFKIMFLVCIAVMLMVPLGFTTWKPEIVSKLDNRMLSKLPQTINEWRIHGEDFLRDRIGLRENIILFYRQAVYRLFHILDHPLYKNGDNGHNYYWYIMALNAYQSFYSNSDMERIVSRLDDLHQYLKSQGKPFLFVHIPLKQNLYPEFTPDYIKKGIKPMLGEALESALEGSGIPHLFTTNVLRQYQAVAPVYNKKYDPAHFNAIGAFAVHEAIAHRLKEWYPDYPLPRWDDFQQTTRMGDLTPFFLHGTSEEIPVLQRRLRSFKVSHLKDNLIGDLPNARVSTNLQAPIKKTLLIIGDSHMYDEHIYSSESVSLEYYAHAFERIYLIPYNHGQNIYALIQHYQPDAVLYEATEYLLLHTPHFSWGKEL